MRRKFTHHQQVDVNSHSHGLECRYENNFFLDGFVLSRTVFEYFCCTTIFMFFRKITGEPRRRHQILWSSVLGLHFKFIDCLQLLYGLEILIKFVSLFLHPFNDIFNYLAVGPDLRCLFVCVILFLSSILCCLEFLVLCFFSLIVWSLRCFLLLIRINLIGKNICFF